ncbi:hypothetical protein HK096_007788 [Nowakowskiella sp. JEL0078]|nr:hypothetical protein HK096_007788 [Nowakowskiella sp. JEL0078]
MNASDKLVEIKNFGPNPTNLECWMYKPEGLPANPPLVVGIHWCTGSAAAFINTTEFGKMADEFKYLAIFPSITRTGPCKCFDVASDESIVHDAGGDSLGIASMVRFAISNLSVDPKRVFVTGHSSGGMTTQLMLGAYPELFVAGSAFAGVPFASWNPYEPTPDSLWNETGAKGKIIKTGQEWGDMVRKAYPEYSGPRPRVLLWHGIDDDVIFFQNFNESIKQWTNVLGVAEDPTEQDCPEKTWIRTSFKDYEGNVKVQAIAVENGPHNVLVDGMAIYVMKFFGFVKDRRK